VCNDKLAEFAEFQQKMKENQHRLRRFKEAMSPVVVVNKISKESTRTNVWQDSDPISNFKLEPSVTIKEEVESYEQESYQPWENLEQIFEGCTEIKDEPLESSIKDLKRVRKQVQKQFIPIENILKTKRTWKKPENLKKCPAGSKRCPYCPSVMKRADYRRHVSCK
jgi:hypothetical protein